MLLLRLILASDVRTEDSLRASASRRALRSLIWPLMRVSRCSKSETLWDWAAGGVLEDRELADRDDWERRSEQGRISTTRAKTVVRMLSISHFITQIGVGRSDDRAFYRKFGDTIPFPEKRVMSPNLLALYRQKTRGMVISWR